MTCKTNSPYVILKCCWPAVAIDIKSAMYVKPLHARADMCDAACLKDLLASVPMADKVAMPPSASCWHDWYSDCSCAVL